MAGRKMVTVYVEKELARAFKIRVEDVGLDISKVVRQLMSEYLARDHVEIEREAESIKRGELEREILEGLRAWVRRNRENHTYIEWITTGMGLKQGSLIRLAEEE